MSGNERRGRGQSTSSASSSTSGAASTAGKGKGKAAATTTSKAKPKGTKRGRSSSAGSSTSQGSTKSGRSNSRDVEGEWEDLYGADGEGFEAAVQAHEVNALRYIAPSTAHKHKQMLSYFIKFLAAGLPRTLSLEQRLEQARELTAADKPLPEIKLFLEFLRFWAKGSRGKISPDGKLSALSLHTIAKDLQSALHRAHRKQFSAEDQKTITDFLFNASKGSDPLVHAVNKEKKIVSYADLQRILANMFDRREGTWAGRVRLFALFCLILWAFGVRPGCVVVHEDYIDAEGEVQALLNKDVEIAYEGIGPEGDPVFTAKITQVDEGLVVRLRSLPRAKAHMDPIIYLLAQGIYRSVFQTDVLAILLKPDILASPENPLNITYKEGKEMWPVFAQGLHKVTTVSKKKVDGAAKNYMKRRKLNVTVKKGAVTASKSKKGKSAKGKEKEIVGDDEDMDTGTSGGNDETVAEKANLLAFIKKEIGIDYSIAASYVWIKGSFARVRNILGFRTFMPYDFRRAFAMNMKSCVPVAELEYLMGHRPDSKMVNKSYQSTERGHDTTAARFGVASESASVTRNSVGHQAGKDSDLLWDRINLLSGQVKTALTAVESRFGSFSAALEKDENDADVICLLDMQALLLSALSEVRHRSTTSSLAVVAEEASPIASIIASTSAGSAGLLSYFDTSAVVALDPGTNLDPSFEVDYSDLPPMPAPLPGASEVEASTAEASTSSIETEEKFNLMSREDQLKEALQEAESRLQHPLSAVATSAAPREGPLASVNYILSLYYEQDLAQAGVCLLCYQDGDYKLWGDQLHKHTFACENKKLALTHVRCLVCAAMLLLSDPDEACSHLLACYDEWLTLAEEKAKSSSSPSLHVESSTENEESARPTTPTQQNDPSSTQLSRISEVSNESELADEGEDGDGDETVLEKGKKSEKEDKVDKSAKTLCNPLKAPIGTFCNPPIITAFTARPICAKCMKEAKIKWDEGEAVKVTLHDNYKDFEAHYMAGHCARAGAPNSGLDWDEEFDCDMPGCSFNAELQELIPHWCKVHNIRYVKKGRHAKDFVDAADLPDDLGDALKFQHELDVGDTETLSLWTKNSAALARRIIKKDAEQKALIEEYDRKHKNAAIALPGDSDNEGDDE